jgi:hypothetical protein
MVCATRDTCNYSGQGSDNNQKLPISQPILPNYCRIEPAEQSNSSLLSFRQYFLFACRAAEPGATHVLNLRRHQCTVCSIVPSTLYHPLSTLYSPRSWVKLAPSATIKGCRALRPTCTPIARSFHFTNAVFQKRCPTKILLGTISTPPTT